MLQNPYFKESEFDCKCGKCTRPPNVPSDELVSILCEIREFFEAPIIINSAYRCPTHNAKVGGATNSQHTIGSAVDFIVKGVKTEEVYNFVLEKWGEEPLGIAIKRNTNNPHAGFVHLDTRGKKARWEYK
ncbi:peptidase M15 family protein [Helicobacter valdiviensis]|uniref:Peptidase M15 family protein n=1 Tax=Helicobacter valdiviensis TaxID=1458358 RepID=A0A2W6MRY4_9HELI|nr:D-Ala-D-Ala carboxypeptidase family metallohydrolase [Helicobacter valdiviensis]PZT47232.1 peptidase M15 family protein [Helicobacter valdiviensis]